jgi:dipeptidyl aminopeptidase/acylaminoacyl peptidase
MNGKSLSRAFLSILVVCSTGCASLARYDGHTEPVTFSNGPVKLGGILVEPRGGGGPFPAVVFVHGSGPSTYDRPAWKAHANALTKRGFAVLVFDKRGSAHSTGNLATSDYEDLANDVISGVHYLRGRPDILPRKIGILGRSEGGWVGPLAAAELGDLAFVIMSSGAAVSPYDQTLYAVATELRGRGAPETVVARALEVRKDVWDYYRKAATEPHMASGATRDSLNAALASFASYKLDEMPAAIAPYDSAVYAASARMRFFEPLPVLKRLNAPLLVVLGENDKSVEPGTTVAVLQGLKRDQRKDITIKIYLGTDHSLLARKIPPGYVSGYLEFVADWAAARVR